MWRVFRSVSQTRQDSLAPFYENLLLEHMQKASISKIYYIPVFLPSGHNAEDHHRSHSPVGHFPACALGASGSVTGYRLIIWSYITRYSFHFALVYQS